MCHFQRSGFAVWHQPDPMHSYDVKDECKQAIDFILVTDYRPPHQPPIVFFNNGRCRIRVRYFDPSTKSQSPSNNIWPAVHEIANSVFKKCIWEIDTEDHPEYSYPDGEGSILILMEFMDNNIPDSDGMPPMPSCVRRWKLPWTFWGPKGQLDYPLNRYPAYERHI